MKTNGTLSHTGGTPWTGKRVYITGVCGTIGRELVAQLRRLDVAAIVGVDINETELFFMSEELRSDPRVQLLLCDIRVPSSLTGTMHGADIVVHAAAYKHVHLCECSPAEAVMTNVVGTQNVIAAAFENSVERVLFTSSDKAVNPTSVLGTSKLMAERLMTAASTQHRKGQPIFASIRFGNVLGSRGSVVPLFKSQIAAGGPVTLTHRAMTRFIMSIREAAQMVLDATFLARGGEVIVMQMPALRIEDLANVMIETFAPDYGYAPANVEIVVIGYKPGEKMHEELTNEEEVRRTFSWKNYLIVKPALFENGANCFADWERQGMAIDRPYNSSVSRATSRHDIRALLSPAHAIVEVS